MFDTRTTSKNLKAAGDVASSPVESQKPLQLAEGITGSRHISPETDPTPHPVAQPNRGSISPEVAAAAARRAKAAQEDGSAQDPTGGASVIIGGRSSTVGPAQNVNGGVHGKLP